LGISWVRFSNQDTTGGVLDLRTVKSPGANDKPASENKESRTSRVEKRRMNRMLMGVDWVLRSAQAKPNRNPTKSHAIVVSKGMVID
jgi:hypothetical protein